MIQKIIIKNVATFDGRGVEIDHLKKINFIYGANGCGKTTISNPSLTGKIIFHNFFGMFCVVSI